MKFQFPQLQQNINMKSVGNKYKRTIVRKQGILKAVTVDLPEGNNY